MQRMNWRSAAAGAWLAALAVLPGCGFSGSLTNDRNITGESPDSSVAGPTAGDITTAAVFNGTPDADFHMDRATFGTQLTVQPGPTSLAFADNLPSDAQAAAARGLALFIDPRLSNSSGVGPYFNQRNCLGCHQSQLPGRIPTPVSRARTEDAFLLFGDFNAGSGAYDPRSDAGGPVLHRQNLPGFPPQQLPPTKGEGWIRVTGMRSGPPYIGRGLLEAIPDDELLMRSDEFGNSINGPGIRGEANLNSEAASGFIGASTTVRVGRFGLRAAGPSLLSFDIGGLNGEIGLTSPFAPNENEPALGTDGVPDPEVSTGDVHDISTMIRMMAPPVRNRTNVVPDLTNSEDRGRILFGANYAIPPFGFRAPNSSLDLLGAQPGGPGEPATAPNLNCAGCHTPVMITGQSPADQGANELSNKKFYPFSDMLLHHMGTIDFDAVLPAQGRAEPDQFRTPPLMGLGLTGPPFFHDGRFRAELGIDEALRQAIEAHDSPGSEAQAAGQAFKRLEAAGSVTAADGTTYTAADLINFLKGL